MTSPVRRGNALFIITVLTTMIGFTAMSVDIGLVTVAQSQLQVAADAAALAAAGSLDGTAEGLEAAAEAAAEIASEHSFLGNRLSVRPSDVELALFDEETGTLVPTADALEADAVRITLQPQRVTTSFASVAFGVTHASVQVSTVARRPSGAGPAASSTCFLPVAVPDCHVTGVAEGENPPPIRLHIGTRTPFTPAEAHLAGLLRTTLDALELTYGAEYVATLEEILAPHLWPGGVPPSDFGWARPEVAVDESWLDTNLAGRCDAGEIIVGELVELDEADHGDVLTDILDILDDRGAVAPDPWLPDIALPVRDGVSGNLLWSSDVAVDAWGNTMQGPVALVDAGDCGAPTVTGPLTVTGIAWGAIYDVKTTGPARNLWLQLDLVNEYDVWGDVAEDGLGNVLGRGVARFARVP